MLERYKDYLNDGLAPHYDYKRFYNRIPLFRYDTFKKAFDLFTEINGKVIVELGTIRSFVHGGLEGCNTDNILYWTPDKPQNWDWGAGMFSLMAVEEFFNKDVQIHTVDICRAHINRSQIITSKYSDKMNYHIQDSVLFLESWISSYKQKIDLLYLDTGDMTPIEPTALHQLNEARVVVENNILSDSGLILIDDVRNPTPIIIGNETNLLGKAKYSIPYLIENNFEIIMDEYQVLLRKK